jgi:hypothetical protein
MSKDVLDYLSSPAQTEQKLPKSSSATGAAIRLVGIAMFFLGGTVLTSAGCGCECIRSGSVGQPLIVAGVLVMLTSAAGFFVGWMAAPR